VIVFDEISQGGMKMADKTEVKSDTMIIEWLRKNWFLFAAILAAGVAWGQAQMKIQSLEEAVKSNSETQAQVQGVKGQMERMDERTKMMQESMARQEKMIFDLVQIQQRSRSQHLSSKMKQPVDPNSN
jgi:hypothetical protein